MLGVSHHFHVNSQTGGYNATPYLDYESYSDFQSGGIPSPAFSDGSGSIPLTRFKDEYRCSDMPQIKFEIQEPRVSVIDHLQALETKRQQTLEDVNQEPDTTIKTPPPPKIPSDLNSTARSDSSESSSSENTTPTPPGEKRKGAKAATKRTIYTQIQLATLERRFIQQSFLSREERQELAASLNISERQVMVWFQNRRGRLKKRGTADTAYNPLKLNELNTRRPYPFLCGMLSSMHYQPSATNQQVWSMYPEDVKTAATSCLSDRHASPPTSNNAVRSPTTPNQASPELGIPCSKSPPDCSLIDSLYETECPPNVVIGAREMPGDCHDARIRGQKMCHTRYQGSNTSRASQQPWQGDGYQMHGTQHSATVTGGQHNQMYSMGMNQLYAGYPMHSQQYGYPGNQGELNHYQHNPQAPYFNQHNQNEGTPYARPGYHHAQTQYKAAPLSGRPPISNAVQENNTAYACANQLPDKNWTAQCNYGSGVGKEAYPYVTSTTGTNVHIN